jgi:4'-phosphopantetheinyl transferase
MLGRLDRSETHIRYCFTAELDIDAVNAAVQTLSTDERARYDRLRSSHRRRDFAVAHGLLRQLLSAVGGRPPDVWRFETNQYGKPLLTRELAAGTGLTFNLAHTDGLVACIVAPGVDVGIDVEEIERAADEQRIAGRYFSPVEQLALDECSEQQRRIRFFEIWTLKEAYLKAIGTGFFSPLADFGFIFEHETSLRLEPPAGSDWRFALYAPSQRHRIAVAIRGEAPRCRVNEPCDESTGRIATKLRASVQM